MPTCQLWLRGWPAAALTSPTGGALGREHESQTSAGNVSTYAFGARGAPSRHAARRSSLPTTGIESREASSPSREVIRTSRATCRSPRRPARRSVRIARDDTEAQEQVLDVACEPLADRRVADLAVALGVRRRGRRRRRGPRESARSARRSSPKIASGTNLSAERRPQIPCRRQSSVSGLGPAPAPGADARGAAVSRRHAEARAPRPRARLRAAPANLPRSRSEACAASGCRRRSARRAARSRGPASTSARRDARQAAWHGDPRRRA